MTGIDILTHGIVAYDGEEDIKDCKLQRGNWTDMHISCTSLRCDFFVTEDNGLKKRLERLKDIGMVKYKILSFQDFITDIMP